MEYVVHIIHPFDVIRHGLESIARSIPLIEVKSYNSFDGIEFQPNVKNLILFDLREYGKYIEVKQRYDKRYVLGIFIKVKNEKVENPEIKSIDVDINEKDLRTLIRDELGLTGIRVGDLEKNALTPREVEVVRCIAKGMSNKEMADYLCISTHTVITHRKNITTKLGIKSAPGIAVFALLEGIISGSDVTL